MKTFLRRYTELPFVVDFLQTKTLTLLRPISWDDKNDAYYINQYAERHHLKAAERGKTNAAGSEAARAACSRFLVGLRRSFTTSPYMDSSRWSSEWVVTVGPSRRLRSYIRIWTPALLQERRWCDVSSEKQEPW